MLYSDKEITPLKLIFKEIHVPVYTFNTLIVGSGAAGLNAADSLFNMGQKNIAIITEGMKTGISKNTGDNGQTYYRAATTSLTNSRDSVYDMAEKLYNGGSMDGDIALTESALSLRCFHRLADIGVNFPQSDYGEFLGYSDDISGEKKSVKNTIDAGMFTAKKITEQFEKTMLDKSIPIFNRFRVVAIIKDTDDDVTDFVVGLLAIDKDMQIEYKGKMTEYMQNTRRLEANKSIFGKIQKRILRGNTKSISDTQIRMESDSIEEYGDYTEEPVGNKYGYTLFRAVNIIYAAGSPGGIYCSTDSVYPSDVMSSLSSAFAAGVYGKNLTETKFGIASIVSLTASEPDRTDDEIFKWKMSGAFQEAVPRYFSTDANGNDEKEFLDDYFNSKFDMFKAIIDKGQNWHFDVRELYANGSSVIDFAVYIEKSKGRKVYLDYMSNPECLSLDKFYDLDKSDRNAVFSLLSKPDIESRPYERLMKINFASYNIFYDNGIDLKRTPVEINICAEHLNGGLVRDIYSESNVKHFFPVGEAAATFGVYAPIGSSLNSTQVTSFRAAQKIVRDYNSAPVNLSDFWAVASDEVNKYIVTADQLLKNAVKNVTSENIFDMRNKYRARFSECGMIVRPLNDILLAITECVMDMANFIKENSIDDIAYLADVFVNHDILVTQYTFLHAIKNYIISGGRSRGSYIITENKEDVAKIYKDTKNFDDLLNQKINYTRKQSGALGIIQREVEETIEEIDFNKFTSYIKIKSFMTYDIEFFKEEVREIPDFRINFK